MKSLFFFTPHPSLASGPQPQQPDPAVSQPSCSNSQTTRGPHSSLSLSLCLYDRRAPPFTLLSLAASRAAPFPRRLGRRWVGPQLSSPTSRTRSLSLLFPPFAMDAVDQATSSTKSLPSISRSRSTYHVEIPRLCSFPLLTPTRSNQDPPSPRPPLPACARAPPPLCL